MENRFDFEIQKLKKELKKRKAKRILIQLPEGIKKEALKIKKELNDLNLEIFFSGESCFGGCDISINEAKLLKVDLIVHFGHTKFINVNFPIIYIPIKDLVDLTPLLKKSINELKDYKKIGLSSSIQHLHKIKEIKNFYEKNKKKVILSKKEGLVAYEGHIVGCQYKGLKSIEKKVDCFIIVGNQFHALGAAISLEKPVFLLDVYNKEIKNMEELKKKIILQRIKSIEEFKKAEKIGLIISTKTGQNFYSLEKIKQKLKENKKDFIIITMNEITPEKIMNFYDVEAFVELSCPRIAIDDFSKYQKPILTFKETLFALNNKKIDELFEEGFI